MKLEELREHTLPTSNLREAIDAAICERDELRSMLAFTKITAAEGARWMARAEKAEAELAALKKRIADAPMTAVGNLHLFEYHAPFVGKRVRLLEEDDNEP